MAAVSKKEPKNQVDQEKILVETILKENRHQQLYTTFGINPFKKHHLVTPKIGTQYKKEDGTEDTYFKSVFQRARLEPVRKFDHPQTSSQEYGWISTPLLGPDRSDRRLFYGRRNSEVTKFMEAVWQMNEASDKKTKPA